jgi:predicted kinase
MDAHELAQAQAVLFIGVQAAGKTTFYSQRFATTHVHVNLDTLRTRAREARLLATCVDEGRSFVVDNTNPTAAQRAPYIALAHAHHYRVIGYYFVTSAADAIARNAARPTPHRVPSKAIWGTRAKLQLPSLDEGFDELWRVRTGLGTFDIEAWHDAV